MVRRHAGRNAGPVAGLVRRAILTPGHVSDKLPFLDLVLGDERAVYADKGYTTAPGIGRVWPSRASPTASWPATTGSGRAMLPGAPGTG
jgi:hypothetical protein